MTRTQALERVSPSAIDRRVASGRWELVRRGVYCIAGAPPSERQAVLAAALATRALASHLTAARIWGMTFPRPQAIELVGGRHRGPGIVVHRSSSLRTEDITMVGRIPATNPARTIVDCAGTVAPSKLELVVDDALRRGLVCVDALRSAHEHVDTGPGRRPTIALRDLLRKLDDPGDSPAEARLVAVLARAGLPAPVLGHTVRIGRVIYRLDVAWPESLVGLEFDSWEFHRSWTSFHRDRQRLRRLTSAGWTILPVTSRTDERELLAELRPVLGFVDASPRLAG